MKNNRANEAVSDIVGTVLLLGMTIALFSVLCIGVLSYPSSPSEPAVNLVGSIKGTYIFLEHCGGEPLDLDTKVIITVGSRQSYSIFVGDENPSEPYLNEEAKVDNKWGIGECLVIRDPSIGGEYVKISVVDTESNSVIMQGSLKGT